MTNRYISRLALCAALSTALAACNHVPGPEIEANEARLDEVVVKLDRSLANQASVEERLASQQQQLDRQQEHLQSLSQDLERALRKPARPSCPEQRECPESEHVSGKVIVGELEEIWLSDLGIPVIARMDTGAQTSFLDARNIETFERDGDPWVRFEIMNLRTNEPVAVERKLRRTVGLVGSDPDESRRRPVVKMGLVIGDIDQTAEFILRDREHDGYQALIGRSILSDVMLVDVSRKNVAPYILPERASTGTAEAR